VQNLQRIHRRMLHHLFFCPIVEVVWKTLHVRMVQGIVPTLDQATCMILPMMAILRHDDGSRLHFNTLGQLYRCSENELEIQDWRP
jgi:hypothetical protein